MRTPDERVRLFIGLSQEMNAALPVRVWVDGDGQMYGDFHSDVRRKRITAFDAIKLLHLAADYGARLISV